jgi:hypothetical protein
VTVIFRIFIAPLPESSHSFLQSKHRFLSFFIEVSII